MQYEQIILNGHICNFLNLVILKDNARQEVTILSTLNYFHWIRQYLEYRIEEILLNYVHTCNIAMCYVYKNLERTLLRKKSLYPYPVILIISLYHNNAMVHT